MRGRLAVGAAISLALLGGCATQWRHPGIADEKAAARQLRIDKARCEAYASGTAPMPVAVVGSAPPAYNYTATTVSPSGNIYNTTGSAVPAPNYAASFAQGFNNGLLIAAASRQAKLVEACMLQLGWSDD